MKILYFTSTGNSLYLAKRLGGKLLSIPQMVKEESYEFEDDVIGIIFPVYGLCIPPYVEEFMKKLKLKSDYIFAIATYGFFSGAVCNELSKFTFGNNRTFDYINKIKMAENCITFADMAKQKGDSEKQQTDISALINDITARKLYVKKESFFHKTMTKNHKDNFEYVTGVGITDRIQINDSCSGCGLCEKLCPTSNIKMENGKPVFGNNCISCGACIQNCSTNALHLSDEKSGARYRNPHIGVSELLIEVSKNEK